MNHAKIVLAILTLVVLAGQANAGAGAELYNEFMDSNAMYPDPKWQEYINELGQKLVKHSGDEDREYNFFLLDSPEINAFATADAYIYINRGIVTFMNSEDQLAAVIGHEIAHVVAKHPAKRRLTNLLGAGAGMAAGALTGRHEMYQVADAATRTLIAGYGRDMELEADRLGAQIMARAGYNPLAVIEAVHVLKDQELFSREVSNQPRNYHGLFATHPQNDKRLHEVVGYALEMLPETTEEPTTDFWTMIDGLSYGNKSPIGVNTDNVFYDESLRIAIEFPDELEVSFNRQQVMATAKGGRREAWLSVVRLVPSSPIEPSDYLRNTLRVSDITSETTLELEGCCEVHLAEISVESTNKKRSVIAVRTKGSDVYIVRGEAGPHGDPEVLLEQVKSTLSGIRNLLVNDMEKADVQRIKVHVAEPGDTYEKLAGESSLRKYPMETLRLINGHHPNGEPRAGDYVKTVK